MVSHFPLNQRYNVVSIPLHLILLVVCILKNHFCLYSKTNNPMFGYCVATFLIIQWFLDRLSSVSRRSFATYWVLSTKTVALKCRSHQAAYRSVSVRFPHFFHLFRVLTPQPTSMSVPATYSHHVWQITRVTRKFTWLISCFGFLWNYRRNPKTRGRRSLVCRNHITVIASLILQPERYTISDSQWLPALCHRCQVASI